MAQTGNARTSSVREERDVVGEEMTRDEELELELEEEGLGSGSGRRSAGLLCLRRADGLRERPQRSRERRSETQLIRQAIRSGGTRIGGAAVFGMRRVMSNWT
jgi:hypothetical protein